MQAAVARRCDHPWKTPDHHRPHAAIGGLPPITRLTNLARVRDHLRRPVPGSRNLLMNTAGNTVSETVPSSDV